MIISERTEKEKGITFGTAESQYEMTIDERMAIIIEMFGKEINQLLNKVKARPDVQNIKRNNSDQGRKNTIDNPTENNK